MSSTSSSWVTPLSRASWEMEGELLGAVESDQGGDGDEAAVALGEAGALPDVGVEDLVSEFGDFGGDVADKVLGGEFWWLRWHGLLQGCVARL
jgi:hypothetical protein